MWNIESTTQLLRKMSQCTDPGELVRLFFDDIRQNVDIRRALVLSSAGLSVPQYRIIHDVDCNPSDTAVVMTDQLREQGLLAEILYRGEFQNISNFTPDACDPAFELLQDSRSLVAFPLFEKGCSVGMVVMLGSFPQEHETAELCALATISALIGRAIETQKLADQLENACHALDSELKAAADVQRWLLPALPKLDEIGIAASYRTARHSGGDYYDAGRLPDGRIGVLIADVSGKGAAAAVLMAVLRSIVHDEVDREGISGPAALLDYADLRLRALGIAERNVFITVFCGVFDPCTREFVYSCAGHNPPRLLRAQDRSVTPLDGAGFVPLGLFDHPTQHAEETAVLMPGDLLLLYTDGITEARSSFGEFFGAERVDQLLRALPHPITTDAAVEAIAEAVRRFEMGGSPADDQTMVALGG